MEAAYPVHVSSARLRLRVPARRGDAAWFDTAADVLAQQPGIAAAHAHADRASLTLHLAARPVDSIETIAPALVAAGIRIAGSRPEQPVMATRGARRQHPETPPDRTGPRAHRRIARGGNGHRGEDAAPTPSSAGLRADRRTIALALFLLLLARHLLRNGWLLPGLALAWYLWERFPPPRPRGLGRR